ncbi:MAG: hypothetical protein U9R60_09950 [Bacteroidota bacterium]|nr:hypothetical protein [Bacteroidota bacterium]
MKTKFTALVIMLLSLMISSSVFAEGYLVTSDLWIKAVINTVEKGPVDAVWQKGGEDTTSRGDRVIWGHFYANSSDVTWGSENNPDLFVKIWFDVSGRVDVNFFHVSVPDIVVYSDYPYDGNPDEHGTTTMSRRYIRQYYENGQCYSEDKCEDGNPPSGYTAMGNPSGYSTINDLRIGSIINTVEKGPIDAVWRFGGQDTTARGDQVVWGHFYASPNDVTWGSEDNPDLFVKIWFDVSGRIDVNCFHVSVPDIEVYSDYPSDGTWDQTGTTIMSDRYIRHEFSDDQAQPEGTYILFSNEDILISSDDDIGDIIVTKYQGNLESLTDGPIYRIETAEEITSPLFLTYKNLELDDQTFLVPVCYDENENRFIVDGNFIKESNTIVISHLSLVSWILVKINDLIDKKLHSWDNSHVKGAYLAYGYAYKSNEEKYLALEAHLKGKRGYNQFYMVRRGLELDEKGEFVVSWDYADMHSVNKKYDGELVFGISEDILAEYIKKHSDIPDKFDPKVAYYKDVFSKPIDIIDKWISLQEIDDDDVNAKKVQLNCELFMFKKNDDEAATLALVKIFKEKEWEVGVSICDGWSIFNLKKMHEAGAAYYSFQVYNLKLEDKDDLIWKIELMRNKILDATGSSDKLILALPYYFLKNKDIHPKWENLMNYADVLSHYKHLESLGGSMIWDFIEYQTGDPAPQGGTTDDVLSSFEEGWQGWTSSSGVSRQTKGDEHGGFLNFKDSGPGDGGRIYAPSSFLGDWSYAENGAHITFDYQIFSMNKSNAVKRDPLIVISGGDASAVYSREPATGTTNGWTPYRIEIKEDLWRVESGTWEDLIKNVCKLSIYLRTTNDTSEEVGIDNIKLTYGNYYEPVYLDKYDELY